MYYKDRKRVHAHSLHALGIADDGANVNTPDRFGTPPLVEAAATGQYFVVRRLLALGANVHSLDRTRDTALREAADQGHVRIVRLLLNHGAKINNKRGYTPLMAAAEWGHRDVLRLLLRRGANVNALTDGWRTALSTAAIDAYQCIPILLAHGADIHAANDSALHIALQADNCRAIELLLAAGADINAQDAAGMTYLMHVAGRGYSGSVKTALAYGADPATPDNAGKMALDYAKVSGNAECVALLQEVAGA